MKRFTFFMTMQAIILSCCLASADEDKYMFERRKLAKKYADIPKVEVILLPELKTKEDYALYHNPIYELIEDRSERVSHFLIDLLDFNRDEYTTSVICYNLTGREKRIVLPLLKDKLFSTPLSSEIKIEYRNLLINDLIRMIVNDVRYTGIHHPPQTIEEQQTFGIYHFQMFLEGSFKTNGRYPKTVSESAPDMLGNQKYEYKSNEQNYLLRLAGPDGIYNTNDDPMLPFEHNLHCFPGNENISNKLSGCQRKSDVIRK